MGFELVRKYGSIATISCYKSAMRHPLLAFMVFLLIWMYRCFPVLFSLLVNASPVFVSTGLLLGTLLSYGHANVPESQEQRKPHHHNLHNLRSGVIGDTEMDWMSGGEERSEVRDKRFGGRTFVVNDMNISDDDHHHPTPSVRIHKRRTSLHNTRTEAKNGVSNQKNNVNPWAKLSDTLQGVAVDPSQSATGLWSKKQRDEDSKGWETGSDLIESSSPSASMGDIFPMLDDLHPLLEPQVPQRTHTSHVSTDAASDNSVESTDIANETDDYDDDDQEDIQGKHDEKATNVDKEGRTATTWTEGDHKNIMNLGTSELERNQQMENLVARQKAIKDMRILAEKKMADLSPDLPFSTTLISTDRRKSFDPPNESILGSVPPAMVPRSNPMDVPYDPKPGTTGDTSQPNEPFRRGHEHFDGGPSPSPYFVSERITPDGTSYSNMHRQMGELSDSKASSESSGSADDMEHTENENTQEADLEERSHTCEVSENVPQRSWSSEDDAKAKLNAGDESGYQEKTSSEWSSSPLSDVSDHIYNEKEGEKKFPETNYFVGPENSSDKSDAGHHSPPTMHAEDQHVDNKKQMSVVASSHYPEEILISRPEEFDRSMNKPLAQELQGKDVSPKINSTSTSTRSSPKINSASTTKTPPSPTYSSDMSRVETESVLSDMNRVDTESVSGDTNRVETESVLSDMNKVETDSLYARSSAYYTGTDSEWEVSENEFASASESEMDRTSERAFPQTLTQVHHITSWLTGWRT